MSRPPSCSDLQSFVCQRRIDFHMHLNLSEVYSCYGSQIATFVMRGSGAAQNILKLNSSLYSKQSLKNVVQAERTHQLTFVLALKNCRPTGKQIYRINKKPSLFYRLIFAQRDPSQHRLVLCCIQGIKRLFQVKTMRKAEVLLMSASQSEGLDFRRLSLEVKSKTETKRESHSIRC